MAKTANIWTSVCLVSEKEDITEKLKKIEENKNYHAWHATLTIQYIFTCIE